MQLRLMYVNVKEKHLFLYVQTERTTNGRINQSGKERRSGCFYGTDGEPDAEYVKGGTVGSLQRRGYCRCDFGYDSGVLGETFPVEGSQIFSYLDDQDSAEQM